MPGRGVETVQSLLFCHRGDGLSVFREQPLKWPPPLPGAPTLSLWSSTKRLAPHSLSPPLAPVHLRLNCPSGKGTLALRPQGGAPGVAACSVLTAPLSVPRSGAGR